MMVCYRAVGVLVVGLLCNTVATKHHQCDDDDVDKTYSYECPSGEYFNECAPDYCDGEYCPTSACDPKPEECPAADPDCCGARCMCYDHLVRNETGICVDPEECPPFECSADNEEYDPCPPVCPGETCQDAVLNVARCNARPRVYEPCKPTCRCVKDFFRNAEGRCVPFDECPTPTCPSGEFYNTCPPEDCSGNFCPSSRTTPQSCPQRKACGRPQCTCNFNTKRSRRLGNCIPISKCPPFKCNQPNEEYVACPRVCPGETCVDYLNNAKCPKFRIGIVVPCKPQCRCKSGHYRNKNNVCVPAQQCKPPGCNGDPNAQAGCGVPCGRTCKLYNKPPPFCPAICKLNACDCKPGYVLNEDTGKCILPAQCPHVRCPGAHEYFDCSVECDNVCETLAKQNKTHCPIVNVKCNEKCYCKDGYARNKKGVCVPYDQCEPVRCPGAHEYFDCGVACDNVCKTLSEQNKTHCPIVNKKCNEMCYCEDGYARNEKGDCVQYDQCKVPTGCNGDPNAEPGCGVPCGRTCKLYDKGPVPCPKICKLNACNCKEGYVLNEDTGKCVLPTQCPKPQCNNDNEVYSSCYDPCPPQTCKALVTGIMCTAVVRPCQSGCRCKPGFYRNVNGDCVSEEDCYKCTGEHELYACGGACDNVCATLSKQNQTDCPIINIKCNEMCYCENGYARNKKGVCVPFNQCEPALTGCNGDPNARPGCGMPCGRTCKLYNKPPVPCPEICKQNACDCNPGYVLNEDTGKCILPAQCPQVRCPGAHEYFDCSVECDNVCETLAKQNKTHCPIVNVKCNEKCYCKDGYARNKKGVCVPYDQCEPVPTGCNGDPNAQPGCGVPCGRTCKLYDKGPVPCPKICKLNACNCKEGYVLNEDTGKCVLPSQCPKPQCNNDNEVYSSCYDPCPPQTCKALVTGIMCTAEVRPCQSGCRCKPGFYRNVNGDCVSEEYCYKCTGEHELYACGGACDNVCATLSKQNQTDCPIINIKCNEMCYCENGYARNKKGVCVPFDQCEPVPTGCNGDPNAQPGCGVPCGRTCKLYNKGPVPCSKICKLNACNCKEGYVLNEDTGKCVLPSQCPKPRCTGAHEYFDCSVECDNVCETLAKQNKTHCPIVNKKCNEKCYCEDGYARNKYNLCVPYDQCEGAEVIEISGAEVKRVIKPGRVILR